MAEERTKQSEAQHENLQEVFEWICNCMRHTNDGEQMRGFAEALCIVHSMIIRNK